MFQQKPNWSPLYFLAALGGGGMVVTFFMYLLFWVAHPTNPIPIYEDIMLAYNQGTGLYQAMIVIALSGIAFFALLHFVLVVWNFVQYSLWKKTKQYADMKGKNTHTQLLAIPLTLAMSINAGFILGAVFVPNLWNYVEYLFPIALTGFVMLGIWAMRLYFDFFSLTLSKNQFDKSTNNSLAQLMPGFAFSMISVGLAAPAAMSHDKLTVAMSILLTGVFMIPAIFITLLKMIIGFTHLLEFGANKTTLPTLWVGVPILTTLSIAMMRIDHGLAHTLQVSEAGSLFFFLTLIFSTQVFLLFLGRAVMKKMNYFQSVKDNEEQSPLIFALICPGVAFSISLHFLINKGLVAAHIIEKFDLTYWVLSGSAIAIQAVTAMYLIKFTTLLIMNTRSAPTVIAA